MASSTNDVIHGVVEVISALQAIQGGLQWPHISPSEDKLLEEIENQAKKLRRLAQSRKQCSCGKPGTMRVDNGLKAGFHCDDCWTKLLSECRSRSW